MLDEMIAKGIFRLQATDSTIEKESILREFADVPGFKQVLKFAFDPAITTGIAKRKLDKGIHHTMYPKHKQITLEMFMNHFMVHQTGDSSDIHFAWCYINQHEGDIKDLVISLVKKTLKIGAGLTTLNDVYGNEFIPILLPMLGFEYRKVKHKIKGMHVASRKIDGQRRLIVKHNGQVTMYTRKGLVDTGLEDIKLEVIKYLPDDTVYDGELEAIGNFENNLALRQMTNSIANSKGVRSGLYFNIFDMIPYDDYINDTCMMAAIARKKLLEILFGVINHDKIAKLQLENMKYVRHAEILLISDNFEAFEDLFNQMIDRGEEGIMLIHASSRYRPGKRQKTWVKMKGAYRDEFVVEAVEYGKPDGKYFYVMGNVIIKYKGYKVEVGSGFSDSQRLQFMKNPDLIVGKIIEIEHQGESKNKLGGMSLSCPVFICFRPDKEV